MKRGCLASTREPGVSSTHLGLLPQPTTSWTMIFVQQETAIYEDDWSTNRKRKVFIHLRVFLLYM
jgi:hypothetical protein